ncbi:flagellar filament capping protein FliD [Massilia horti]|uniref:Flagellar hook-associated protein 2 n=1 Tax=Massilia horti TaxID=2562153 RepID=A0A4Y9SVY0_9BURK|nr:flagellar filament capping protein FliD [Massilia horti]TFW29509.1 flagellar hook protein 2 [Massilia horti]
MGISSAGIGSGLDIEGLISKLMNAEAAPLAKYDKQAAVLQNKLAALGKLGGAVGVFQGTLSTLSNSSTFRALTSKSADETILTGSAGSSAAPGKYNVNISQLAQAQTLHTAGRASMTSLIGNATPTVLTFQFGTVGGGLFGIEGSALSTAVATNGIANGSLTINGTAIATDGSTTGARALAEAINAKSATTGVTASAGATATNATLFAGFGAVDTSGGGSYGLAIGGVMIATQQPGIAPGEAGSLDAAAIDNALTKPATVNSLADAGVTFTGSAVDGTLQFHSASGANITIFEVVGGNVAGGIGAPAANNGSTATATAGITLASTNASPITVGGSAPALAGLTAGSGGSYLGSNFTQDGARASGTVVLDPANQSLAGIRDAINKANIGVQASIVSDGSDNPYHLVITSNNTGASAALKISVSGVDGNPPDAALASLLGYDPGGAQNLSQTAAAQSAKLNVNGIAVTSSTNSVSDAIQGVTLNLATEGSTTLTVNRDTKSVSDAVNAFIKAYNDLNKTIASLTGYNADAKAGGPLQGDATVRAIQSSLRQQLGVAVEGLGGKLTTLSQIGIAFEKDGNLSLDSSKLNKAINDNFADIGGLFAAMGSASDGMVTFAGSSAKTKPGEYALKVTALATQGHLTSAEPLTGSKVIGAGTTWSVTLNQTDPATASKTQSIAIPAGTYDSKQLAAMLRAAINGNSTFAGAGDLVETDVDAEGRLTISSSRYGSNSNISISPLTGTGPDVLFGDATPDPGSDVAGTIGGVAATGSGQTLSGAKGSVVDGMKLTITGGTTGERGTITFSQGYAYQLNNLAASFIGTKGLITGKSDGINVSIKAVQDQRDRFNTRLADIEKRYRAQFTALDTMLASMQSTQNYLTQQLSALAKNSNF